MSYVGSKDLELGKLIATTNFMRRAEDLGEDPELLMKTAVARHAIGDWGECCQEDSASNDEALKNGERLLSVYRMKEGEKFWVITEWDRSVTTILLPEDY